MLPWFSAPAPAQRCTASHSPKGFTLQSGLRKVPKRSGPTLTLSSYTHAHTDLNTNLEPKVILGIWRKTRCLRISKSGLLRGGKQAATEITQQSCLYRVDVSAHVFLCRARLLASMRPPARELILWQMPRAYVDTSPFPFLIRFLFYRSEGGKRNLFNSNFILSAKTLTICLNWHIYCFVVCH